MQAWHTHTPTLTVRSHTDTDTILINTYTHAHITHDYRHPYTGHRRCPPRHFLDLLQYSSVPKLYA
jgi:hypothetical protein